MKVIMDWVYLAGAAAGVVGVIEYLKGLLPNLGSLAWRIAQPVVCAVVAIAGGGGLWQVATNAVMLLAVSTLGYQVIVEAVKRRLG